MVKALIDISNNANRVLAIVKAEFGLKDKSQAIEKLADEYEEQVFEPKVRPSYLKKLKEIEREKVIRIGTLKDFKRMYKIK